MSRDTPDAMNCPPWFCYAGQIETINYLGRQLFIMSPLHSCWAAGQIRFDDPKDERPLFFFFVKDHQRPVPKEFWPHLGNLGAICVCIDRSLARDTEICETPNQGS